jgi:hypothetical protein
MVKNYNGRLCVSMEKKHEICIINCYPECFVTALVRGLQEAANATFK